MSRSGNDTTRLRRSGRRSLIVLGVVAALVVPAVQVTAAGAAAAVSLHKVSFANRSVPGSTCFSSKPIRLHNGHGRGGKGLVVDLVGTSYGDLTRDGHDEAFVHLGCTTGGGTAAAQVKDSWAVYTASGRSVRGLGVISARHQWRHVHNTLVGTPRVKRGVATVREAVYGPADSDCCPSLKATTTWVVRKGRLAVRSTSIGGDLLITATSMGNARLGMTLKQLRAKYTNVHSYGRSGSCSATASFGRQYDQTTRTYQTIFAFFKSGRLVALQPGSDNAVTSRGTGTHSSIPAVRQAYPKAVSTVSEQGYTLLHVRLAKTSLLMKVEKESYGTFVGSSPVLYAGHARTAPHCY